MKRVKRFIFNASSIIALPILLFSTSCSSYKRITFLSTNSPTQAELTSRLEPGKVYSFELEEGQNVFMKFKTITPDTIFGDVQRITITKESRTTGISNTYTFKNVSIDGKPTNRDWPWADPTTHLIGLGHLDIKSINKVSELKFRPGLTVAIVAIPLLIAVIIVASQPVGVLLGGI